MKEKFIEKRFGEKKLKRLEQAKEILADFKRRGFPRMGVRASALFRNARSQQIQGLTGLVNCYRQA